MNKKPTGTTGFIRINPSGLQFHRTKFPKIKEEIEQFITEKFIFDLNKQNTFLHLNNFTKNPENDFDFSLNTSEGIRQMDLMEIAPEDLMEKGYSNVPHSYHDLDFGRKVWSKIKEKSIHYGHKKQQLFLLIYPTDFRFNLSELCIQYLNYLSNINRHCFEIIFYFSLLDDKEGVGRVIYPSEINEFDEDRYKDNITMSLV